MLAGSWSRGVVLIAGLGIGALGVLKFFEAREHESKVSAEWDKYERLRHAISPTDVRVELLKIDEGRIRNNSRRFTVAWFSMVYTVRECGLSDAMARSGECPIVFENERSVSVEVPPGQVRDFFVMTADVPQLGDHHRFAWKVTRVFAKDPEGEW